MAGGSIPFSVARARPVSRYAYISGIPTEYEGVRFRSRTEAMWAAFFDRIGWRWDYEPVDMDGYIPDFIIDFKRAKLLVEVKPELEYGYLEAHGEKICRSGWRGDFLIVGSHPFVTKGEPRRRSLGLLGLWDHESQDGWQPADHAIAIQCRQCGLLAVKHASAAWFCLSCGACEPRVHFDDAKVDTVEELWAEACNRVQWMPRAPATT
jgi:hypothetical protein